MHGIRVTLTEDDESYADHFQRAIAGVEGLEFAAHFSSGEEMVQKLAATKPAVALVDLVLPGLSGAECIQQLSPLLPETAFVVLTGYRDDERLYRSLRAGAAGYVLKTAQLGPVFEAIRSAADGGAPMSPGIARRVVEYFRQSAVEEVSPTDMSELSRKENEVLAALAKGRRYREIAEEQGLSEHTVRTYIRRIYGKLAVTSRSEAVAKFLRR